MLARVCTHVHVACTRHITRMPVHAHTLILTNRANLCTITPDIYSSIDRMYNRIIRRANQTTALGPCDIVSKPPLLEADGIRHEAQDELMLSLTQCALVACCLVHLIGAVV